MVGGISRGVRVGSVVVVERAVGEVVAGGWGPGRTGNPGIVRS
jgi:hypothetical protein